MRLTMPQLLKSLLSKILVRPLALIQVLFQSISARMKLTLFHQRFWAVEFLGKVLPVQKKNDRILVVIAHVVRPEEVDDAKLREIKLNRLKETILGLLRSLADYHSTIELHTMKGRSVADYLPEEIKKLLIIRNSYEGDPMLLEYEAQDLFEKELGKYDWYLAIEDDIVIYDALFIEKIRRFNQSTMNPKIVLQPHRFEMYEKKKIYFDLEWKENGEFFAWNRWATFGIDGVQFGECGNVHAGMYCLNSEQLALWVSSGRHWRRQVVMVGELESAMSGSLFEVFRIYKAHPEQCSYFEVQHWDQKYSRKLELL